MFSSLRDTVSQKASQLAGGVTELASKAAVTAGELKNKAVDIVKLKVFSPESYFQTTVEKLLAGAKVSDSIKNPFEQKLTKFSSEYLPGNFYSEVAKCPEFTPDFKNAVFDALTCYELQVILRAYNNDKFSSNEKVILEELEKSLLTNTLEQFFLQFVGRFSEFTDAQALSKEVTDIHFEYYLRAFRKKILSIFAEHKNKLGDEKQKNSILALEKTLYELSPEEFFKFVFDKLGAEHPLFRAVSEAHTEYKKHMADFVQPKLPALSLDTPTRSASPKPPELTQAQRDQFIVDSLNEELVSSKGEDEPSVVPAALPPLVSELSTSEKSQSIADEYNAVLVRMEERDKSSFVLASNKDKSSSPVPKEKDEEESQKNASKIGRGLFKPVTPLSSSPATQAKIGYSVRDLQREEKAKLEERIREKKVEWDEAARVIQTAQDRMKPILSFEKNIDRKKMELMSKRQKLMKQYGFKEEALKSAGQHYSITQTEDKVLRPNPEKKEYVFTIKSEYKVAKKLLSSLRWHRSAIWDIFRSEETIKARAIAMKDYLDHFAAVYWLENEKENLAQVGVSMNKFPKFNSERVHQYFAALPHAVSLANGVREAHKNESKISSELHTLERQLAEVNKALDGRVEANVQPSQSSGTSINKLKK